MKVLQPLDGTDGSEAPSRRRARVVVERPGRGDVAGLSGLMAEHFGYYFSAALGAGGAVTRRVVEDVLLFGGGRHPLGYRAFYVARDAATGEAVGCLLFHTREAYDVAGRAACAAAMALAVLRRLGVGHLFRTLRNLWLLRAAPPRLGADEARIVYVAVSAGARRAGVGARMLAHVLAAPEGCDKTTIRLEVRESNAGARRFFASQGFEEHRVVRSPGDAMLGRGARVLMVRRRRRRRGQKMTTIAPAGTCS